MQNYDNLWIIKQTAPTLRLRIIAKSAILGKSIEKLLPIYQKIGITEKQIAVWNVEVSDVIQYYAYKIIDVLD